MLDLEDLSEGFPVMEVGHTPISQNIYIYIYACV